MGSVKLAATPSGINPIIDPLYCQNLTAFKIYRLRGDF
jgi:hypothetical protein